MAEDVAVSVGVFWDLESAGKEGPGRRACWGPAALASCACSMGFPSADF